MFLCSQTVEIKENKQTLGNPREVGVWRRGKGGRAGENRIGINRIDKNTYPDDNDKNIGNI